MLISKVCQILWLSVIYTAVKVFSLSATGFVCIKPQKDLTSEAKVWFLQIHTVLAVSWLRNLIIACQSGVCFWGCSGFFQQVGGNTVLVFPGVALLPFVDERRLRAALEEVYPDLTPEESKNWGVELKNWYFFVTYEFHCKWTYKMSWMFGWVEFMADSFSGVLLVIRGIFSGFVL